MVLPVPQFHPLPLEPIWIAIQSQYCRGCADLTLSCDLLPAPILAHPSPSSSPTGTEQMASHGLLLSRSGYALRHGLAQQGRVLARSAYRQVLMSLHLLPCAGPRDLNLFSMGLQQSDTGTWTPAASYVRCSGDTRSRVTGFCSSIQQQGQYAIYKPITSAYAITGRQRSGFLHQERDTVARSLLISTATFWFLVPLGSCGRGIYSSYSLHEQRSSCVTLAMLGARFCLVWFSFLKVTLPTFHLSN